MRKNRWREVRRGPGDGARAIGISKDSGNVRRRWRTKRQMALPAGKGKWLQSEKATGEGYQADRVMEGQLTSSHGSSSG